MDLPEPDGPAHDDDLALGDLGGDVVQRVIVAIPFVDVVEADHASSSPVGSGIGVGVVVPSRRVATRRSSQRAAWVSAKQTMK